MLKLQIRIFSFLSSQKSFDDFKKQFSIVSLAHTDLFDPEFYRTLKIRGDAKGDKKYTFSITNILDVMAFQDLAEAQVLLKKYRKMIYELFPAPKYEVEIFMTTNGRLPHGFHHIKRNDPNPSLANWHP